MSVTAIESSTVWPIQKEELPGSSSLAQILLLTPFIGFVVNSYIQNKLNTLLNQGSPSLKDRVTIYEQQDLYFGCCILMHINLYLSITRTAMLLPASLQFPLDMLTVMEYTVAIVDFLYHKIINSYKFNDWHVWFKGYRDEVLN